MIAQLRGEIVAKAHSAIVVDLNGLGLRAEVPQQLAASCVAGEPIHLYTSLVVREDSLTLYGFASETDLEVFQILLGVSGVGPRSALGVLSELTTAEIVDAVAKEQHEVFRRVSGVGPKLAKMISVSLSGKLERLGLELAAAGETLPAQSLPQTVIDDVVSALVTLGYPSANAQRAVAAASETLAAGDEPDALDSQQRILREALIHLQAGV